ncbi:MAG: D-alanyl-D-alanine carboxypeptidase family protein [Roseburia sp. 1XD42-69]
MVKKRNSRKNTRRKYWKLISILFLIYFSVGIIQNRDSILPFLLERIGVNDNSHSIPISEEWNLIVVNRWNEIPEDFSISLTELSNGQSVDSRIYPYLQEMFDAAREDNIYPIVREGYRTAEEQGEIFNEKVQAYINEGYSKARAEKTAKEWDAVPGTSEHQLGIAVDINADKTQSTNDEVYVWLADLGRILRTFKIKKNVEVIDNGKDDF